MVCVPARDAAQVHAQLHASMGSNQVHIHPQHLRQTLGRHAQNCAYRELEGGAPMDNLQSTQYHASIHLLPHFQAKNLVNLGERSNPIYTAELR